MRVVTGIGESIELGTVETAPTIGIIDYSRRVTDDYGVTTVVQRGFARRMELRLGVPFDDVDEVARRLTDLRATPATWIADDRFGSLSVNGYYKDFEIDHAVPPLSYCRLTIEGLVEPDGFVDAGGDPAPDEQGSTLRLLQPVDVASGVLAASSVAEEDAPAWMAATTYAKGAQVILAATHRIYESLVDGNAGADPSDSTGKWLDVGPTSRWAMFDQALGTATIAAEPIELTLRPGVATSALVLLDTNAQTVRVRAPGYDRTQSPNAAGKVLFLDLATAADAAIAITITPAADSGPRQWDDGASWIDAAVWRDSLAAGDGTVTVGTLLIGVICAIGVTEASPTSSITDYSRREVDDFGEMTIVRRGFAKRMSAKALIRSDAVDLVTGRIAAVRARPCLWLGQDELDSLTVYGFFKDFSIEIGEAVSKLSLSIEGLSTATKLAPLVAGGGTINWPDVVDSDPTRPKPSDGADKTSENTARDTANIGGKPTQAFLDAYAEAEARRAVLENETIPAINAAVAAAGIAIEAAQKDADDAIAAANQRIADARQAADDAVALANNRITANRGILDQALIELAAEVDRAQGADEELSRRIETISASGGYDDTQVRALIQSVDTARADDQRVIAQRVDSVTTDYKNRDSATNTRITQTVTGYADANKALGQRIDSVTTDYKDRDTATNTRITNTATALSDADRALGQRIDSIIAEGGGGSDGVDTVARAEVSRVEQAAISRDDALGQRIDTVSTDFRTLDRTTNARIDSTATALSDADRALGSRVDTVSASFQSAKGVTPNADFAAGEAGWNPSGFTFPTYGGGKVASSIPGVYCQLAAASRTKVVDTSRGLRLHCVFRVFVAAELTYVGLQMFDNTGAHIGNVYAPGFAQVLAPGTYSVDQLYVGQWPETAVPQFRAGGAFIPGVNSVNPLFLANYPDAGGPFAGGYVQIESFWVEEVGTAQLVEARVSSAVTTLADADRALSRRIDSVAAQGGYDDTAVYAEIRRVDETAISRDGAVARRTDTLEAQASPSGGNLVPNSSLSTLDGWTLSFNAGGVSTMGLNGAGDPYRIGGVENNVCLHRTPAGAGLCSEAQSAPFAVRPGSSIQVYALTASHRCYAWVSLYFLDAASNFVGYAGEHTGARINAGGQNINAWDVTGVQEVVVPGNAVRGIMLLRGYDVSSDGYAWFSRPFVTEVKAGTKTWVPYSAGNDRVVTAATSARIEATAITLADADKAIGQRIDSVTTDYQGRDTATNTRITNTATALSDADRALGSRSTVLEAAAASASTSIVRNDTFNFWPAGLTHPSSWSTWAAEGNYRTERVSPGRGGGQYCVRTLNDVAGVNSGFVQTIYTAGAGKWVIEVTVNGDGSGLSGAGVTLHGQWNLDFLSDPDVNGYVGNSTTEVRSWSKMVDLDGRDQINVHAMHGWTGFGRGIAAKYMFWHRLRLRPATDGEIKAGKADAALNNPGGVLARLSSHDATFADLPNRYAAASRVSTLESQVNFASDSGLQRTINARIEDRATSIANDKAGAVAQTVSQLRSEYDQTAATVRTESGTIADVNYRTRAYWRSLAVAGNNRAQITMYADSNLGAGVDIIGDVSISGNLLVGGSVTTREVAPNAVSESFALSAQNVQVNANAIIDSARATISTSSSSAVRVEYKCLPLYTASQGGSSSGCYGTIIRIANGVETEVLPVRFASNTFVNNWAIDFPPEGSVTYVLRFRDYIATGSGGYYWTISQIQLGVMGFKR